ncbi:MAG: hypothetical protein QOI85_1526 [Chloroflexota bacterium]|jgi:hypothetical protein|nr:hypothetical protein [Chloroflexota bacterium]
MTNYPTTSNRQDAVFSPRKVAVIAGIGLLVMALLAPFALFGVIRSLVVPGDAAATVQNISASEGLFRAGIAAFLIVIMLDVVVAWALYVLLMPVGRTVALLTAWLRLVFAAVFGYALVNLLDVAQLVGGAEGSALQGEQLRAQVMASLASFDNGWTGIALAIFGLHLFGLGYLLFRSAHFPRFLGVLVGIAGGGYLVDSFGMILVPDYAWTVGTFTFVGEALLILWLFWRAIRGFPSESSSRGEKPEPRLAQPAPLAS